MTIQKNYKQLFFPTMKNINTLAKQLDFKTPFEYFEYCVSSYINGNRTQCKRLFNDMKKEDRKRLLFTIKSDYCHIEGVYDFYFDLL